MLLKPVKQNISKKKKWQSKVFFNDWKKKSGNSLLDHSFWVKEQKILCKQGYHAYWLAFTLLLNFIFLLFFYAKKKKKAERTDLCWRQYDFKITSPFRLYWTNR